MQRSTVIILFGLIISLAGCGRHGNNLETYDFSVKYYLSDSLLQYVNVSVSDALHPDEGELPYSSTGLDTLVSDATIWQHELGAFYRANTRLYASIPVASIRVLTISRQLPSGTYNYSLHFSRNTTPIHSTMLHLLLAVQSSTSSKSRQLIRSSIYQKVEAAQLVPLLTEWEKELTVTSSL